MNEINPADLIGFIGLMTMLIGLFVISLKAFVEPECYGDYRSGQEAAERDCDTCEHKYDCLKDSTR